MDEEKLLLCNCNKGSSSDICTKCRKNCSKVDEISHIESGKNLDHGTQTPGFRRKIIPSDDIVPLSPIGTTGSRFDHCHVSGTGEGTKSNNERATRSLIVVCLIALVFMLIEIAGGVISSSLAILTDAAHLLSDVGGFCISLFALWVARKPATVRMSFGYYRAEVMGAVVSVLVIWVLSGVLIYLAIRRIVYDNFDIDADIMILTAAIGIAINFILLSILHFTGHGHSHSHSNTGHDLKKEGGGDPESIGHGHEGHSNMNVKAAFIHCIGDLLQSAGVLAAALAIKIGGKDYKIADPICTFVFSIIVLITTLTILRDAVFILMEGVPRNIDYNALRSELGAIPGVQMVHGLHVWSLTTSCTALAVHLAVDDSVDKQDVLNASSERIRSNFDIAYTTIQVERYLEDVMPQCDECIGPS